mmetsp:Transcript_17095/g.29371  ORF Transcript_17095/g.29371 Transcript_17095/m.29371 type:complete len:542 (-) Transcript_17095:158-1783(-)|eukprot:CAMPEP_0203754874 /NCGR_PEP_ID=MMETSP0098-20131031/8426_1 /ASSEMBLY_ACC=CAM_ASM_000208 /TAXON_ID=96639 /ORGANISM=" , Strain NY0313808BC1" /LENGTH=541 /DNA_ID=CAMNT_0050646103 /DNA_START=407 /DNA_END=2032 /DNA_ORIENTATION=+
MPVTVHNNIRSSRGAGEYNQRMTSKRKSSSSRTEKGSSGSRRESISRRADGIIPKRREKDSRLGKSVESNDEKVRTKKALHSRKKNNNKDSQEIVIHVCDEARSITRDFFCAKDTLVKEMKYFKSYLQDLDKVDISVHCDVHIFDWLMKYVHEPNIRPEFEVRTAVSILIASNFLGMATLVELALDYVALHLHEIAKLPIDLNCLTEALLTRISEKLSLEQVCDLSDPESKIVSDVYRIKVEKMISNCANEIAMCSLCDRLFITEFQTECNMASVDVDFEGNIRRIHKPKNGWSLVNDFIVPQRKLQKQSWESIFWCLWGTTHVFKCTTCDRLYNGCDTSSCVVHKVAGQVNTVEQPSSCGTYMIYSCCGIRKPALPGLFPNVALKGCTTDAHIPASTYSSRRNITFLNKMNKQITQLQGCAHTNMLTNNSSSISALRPVDVLFQASEWKPKQEDLAWRVSQTQRSTNNKKSSKRNTQTDAAHPDEGKGSFGSDIKNLLESVAMLNMSDRPDQHSWAIERQRDEDTVCMRGLIEKLKTLRR